MAQHTDIVLPRMRYTRRDFTALRAFLFKVALPTIARLYYDEDELDEMGGAAAVHQVLRAMRDDLVLRTIESNPQLASAFTEAHQDNLWHRRMVDYLVDAADKDSVPLPGDRLSAWLRPVVVRALHLDDIGTLGALVSRINLRGLGWYRPIPRLGAGKARVLERWLAKHESTLGPLDLLDREPAAGGDLVVLEPGSYLAPMDRVQLAASYDGSHGANRNPQFCLIAARNDLEAVTAYLYKFRGQAKTFRSYQKELERFLLWCVSVRGIPLSSVLVADCEAYKDFLTDIPASWQGPRAPRTSPQWRPFAPGQFSPQSQGYAIRCIMACFTWLVAVRYLGGNPWVAVAAVRIATELVPIQVHKALTAELWDKLTASDGILDTLCNTPDVELRNRYHLRGQSVTGASARFRLLRATLLVLGTAGLRREEAASASRDRLQPYEDGRKLWSLDVLGKGNKWRRTYLPVETIEAIRAHWQDRLDDFEDSANLPLLAPLTLPEHPAGLARHRTRNNGYTPDTLYKMLTNGLHRVAADDSVDLTEAERRLLDTKGAHAFRHTFGTLAATKVPLVVLQQLMGHGSPETTVLYTQQEEKTKATAMANFFQKRARPSAR